MSSTQQNTARIAKNTGYLYLRMILVTLVNLYTSRVVLQALGFEDFGIYNVIASVIVFFSFFNHALKNATTRFLSVEMGKNDQQGLVYQSPPYYSRQPPDCSQLGVSVLACDVYAEYLADSAGIFHHCS